MNSHHTTQDRSSHQTTTPRRKRLAARVAIAVLVLVIVGVVRAAVIDMTLEDFHLSGTQMRDVTEQTIWVSSACKACHANYDYKNEPGATWAGSLMAVGGRDPLFLAQMATANQDVGNIGYACMRCHVPMSFVTGHAKETDGGALDDTDMDGVNCHFCHSMVDPIYKPGISPIEDEAILANMDEVPEYYGNAMFVLDPNGLRRGPYEDAEPPHEAIAAPFIKTGEFCGTCHEVGNMAITRQDDGTYLYNNIDERTPNEDPRTQFPLERTYSEWKLSSFASGGVDMGGRFGGTGPEVVSTCQDCHMPKTTAKGAFYGPERDDLAKHDFSGSSAWVLEITALYYRDDPLVKKAALKAGQKKSINMLKRAASLEVVQDADQLAVRVINETGHKLPTGHIEGRRLFINVKFADGNRNLIHEYGHYDYETAHLDEESTTVYEMHLGLSDYASKITGYPPGETTHMALADVIMKDNRIPPRGFNNAAFEAAGAPVVAYTYEDGQYWDDTLYAIPEGAVYAKVTVNYQIVTAHYIEALYHGNTTNHWGETLYNLWLATDKAPPIAVTSKVIRLN